MFKSMTYVSFFQLKSPWKPQTCTLSLQWALPVIALVWTKVVCRMKSFKVTFSSRTLATPSISRSSTWFFLVSCWVICTYNVCTVWLKDAFEPVTESTWHLQWSGVKYFLKGRSFLDSIWILFELKLECLRF